MSPDGFASNEEFLAHALEQADKLDALDRNPLYRAACAKRRAAFDAACVEYRRAQAEADRVWRLETAELT